MNFVCLNIFVGEWKWGCYSILILKKITFCLKILKGQTGEEDPKRNAS